MLPPVVNDVAFQSVSPLVGPFCHTEDFDPLYAFPLLTFWVMLVMSIRLIRVTAVE